MKMNRRSAMMLGTAAAAAGILPSASRADGKYAGQKLVYATWGGEYEKAQRSAYIEPFISKTGASVTIDGPVDAARARVMLEQKSDDWNLICGTEAMMLSYTKEGWLAPVNEALMTNLAQIPEKFRHPTGISIEVGAYTLAHVPSAFAGGQAPKVWADLFDLKAFPGKRMLQDSPIGSMELALLADGVKPEDLYPIDIERALAKLDEIKDDLILFKSHSQSQQLISDKVVTCGLMYSARVYTARKMGAEVDLSWEQNLMSATPVFVPAHLKDQELAWALANEMLDPHNQATSANLMTSSPTNPAAFEFIDPEVAKWLPTHPDNEALGYLIDATYWGENLATILPKWQSWQLM